MTQRIIPAILSGGAGTRLWPASTDARPKQFLALAGSGESLFTQTARRMSGNTDDVAFTQPIVICNARHGTLAREHLSAAGVRAAAIVLEPAPRNTAAAAAVVAAVANEIDPDALVLLAPSDHLVADRAAFLAAVARAAPFARTRIVTFGIHADRPETGYGYIKSGTDLGAGVHAIAAFREKPSADMARAFLAEGGYSWNAGMFLFSPRMLLQEFAHAPEIRDAALAALAQGVRRGDEVALDADAFAACPSAPLDIAVMEKTARAAVAPCDIGWADVGSWSEIWRLAEKDSSGNAMSGPAFELDARNNLLHADGVKVCVAGVSDLIVVATPEAVIVLPRERAQDVKALRELAEKK